MDVAMLFSANVFWIRAAAHTGGGTEEQYFTKLKPVTQQCLFASHSNTEYGLSERNFQQKHVGFFPSKVTIDLSRSTHWCTSSVAYMSVFTL